jgi:molecular chaperone DnaK
LDRPKEREPLLPSPPVNKKRERLVGILAKRQSITNPANTFFSVKRLIGRKWTDVEVQRDKAWLPYELLKNPPTAEWK